MTDIQWRIPPSTIRWLDEIPRDLPVAMLIRHSVREYLPPGDAGYTMPITEIGHHLADELGVRLGTRLRSVHASPLLRTMQTASCLSAGAGLNAKPLQDNLLGDPGAFVVDHRAGDTWKHLGHEEVMRHFVEENEPLPGCAKAEPAARFLVHHMLSQVGTEPGIHAFATHDSLVTATVAHLVGVPLSAQDWPWYLEAAFFWKHDGQIHSAYREWHAIRSSPLITLTEHDVVGFARREVAATIGLDCQARFFLAGGAFKTLLTGRPPRDLHFWAPSVGDRAVLESTLRQHGAKQLPERPHTQGFQVGNRVVELSFHTEPNSLEERLLRFDLALSAIGTEHFPSDKWRAVVHPLAHKSVDLREVLLLDELKNWRHGLASLVRLRRYAKELGYALPASEEDRIWSIFERQPRKVQSEMLEHFQCSAWRDQGVEENAASRIRP